MWRYKYITRSVIMKKWVCKVCGYVYTGDNPPAECPQCHAKNAFVEQKADSGFADEHKVGIAKGLDAEVVQGLKDNFNGECCEVGMYIAMSRQADREGYPEVAEAYFCLREDFKQVEREPSEGCPLDDYGLSMIAVSVDMDGSCNTITCRWNHKNGGNDSIMTPKELSNIIGKNFYETFLPYTEEELAERKAKKCNSLFELYQDYVAWDISEMIDIERHFNNSYDEDKDAYYDEDEGGYVTEYENEYKEALESKDDINDISGDWSVVAYAGFKDNSDISEDEPPCILINTEKNSIIVNDLFDFDSEFYMMSNFAVGTLYGRKGVKVIVDTDKMSYLTNDVYSNVFFTHRNL